MLKIETTDAKDYMTFVFLCVGYFCQYKFCQYKVFKVYMFIFKFHGFNFYSWILFILYVYHINIVQSTTEGIYFVSYPWLLRREKQRTQLSNYLWSRMLNLFGTCQEVVQLRHAVDLFLSFVRILHTNFQSGCINLHSLQQ